ncbi:MAG TPA: hypothetical protein VLG16_03555 [Candidatus Saccharimonadales bacterium]|nr:hypothetical protein [Candidatus Saccharimonadales bacterium]
MSNLEPLSEYKPSRNEVREVLAIITANKLIFLGNNLISYVAGKGEEPNRRLPLLREETLAIGNELASSQDIQRRVGRAGVLLGTMQVETELRHRAYRQLAGIGAITEVVDTLASNTPFNDMNDGFAFYDLVHGLENIHPTDVGSQFALEYQIFSGAHLAAEQYAIAYIEEAERLA